MTKPPQTTETTKRGYPHGVECLACGRVLIAISKGNYVERDSNNVDCGETLTEIPLDKVKKIIEKERRNAGI